MAATEEDRPVTTKKSLMFGLLATLLDVTTAAAQPSPNLTSCTVTPVTQTACPGDCWSPVIEAASPVPGQG